MNDKIRALMDFLDASRSVYHTVAYISNILDKAGYTHLPEGDDWILEDGGKYYITRNMSTIIAFRIPHGEPAGFLHGHLDRGWQGRAYRRQHSGPFRRQTQRRRLFSPGARPVLNGGNLLNIQIFGKSKCFDTKKAERWFKERRIKFQSIDLVKFGMSGKEFDSVLRAVGGIDNLIDWENKSQEITNMKYMDDKIAKEDKVYDDPSLMKTPIVRNGKQATVGFCPEIWATWE